MPGMYEVDQPMKIAELGNTIFCAESDKTPFSRLLKRGKKPVQMLSEWPVQAYPRRGFAGTIDGTDITAFSKTTRVPLESYAMWMMSQGWMVSKLAQLTQTAGVKNEQAKQAADDSLLLAQQIERQLLSDMDTQAEADANAYQSRGAFSWLATAEQTTKPVPAAFRPGAACVYTSALASFLPANMNAMLTAMSKARRGPVDLTAFVGIDLKSQMSSWPQKQYAAQGAEVAALQFNLDASEKKLMQIVDFFEFDAGKVKAVPSYYLLCDKTTGEDSAYTAKSGIFVDLAMWEINFLQEPTSWVEQPKSGGPRGYHDAVYILKCLNPLGQGMVKTNT
jgi:hypothetical protein